MYCPLKYKNDNILKTKKKGRYITPILSRSLLRIKFKLWWFTMRIAELKRMSNPYVFINVVTFRIPGL